MPPYEVDITTITPISQMRTLVFIEAIYSELMESVFTGRQTDQRLSLTGKLNCLHFGRTALNLQ
jgi:hypothetical protein